MLAHRPTYLMLLALAACAFPDEDFDLDGWTVAEGDCADLDARIHPEADDVLADGIDQDCDGVDPVMIVAGVDHSCFLGNDGSVRCHDPEGIELSDGPQQPLTWVKLAAGDNHTCALSTTGFIECWGSDDHGQTQSPQDPIFVDVMAGGNWSLGTDGDGEGTCWGAVHPAGEAFALSAPIRSAHSSC